MSTELKKLPRKNIVLLLHHLNKCNVNTSIYQVSWLLPKISHSLSNISAFIKFQNQRKTADTGNQYRSIIKPLPIPKEKPEGPKYHLRALTGCKYTKSQAVIWTCRLASRDEEQYLTFPLAVAPVWDDKTPFLLLERADPADAWYPRKGLQQKPQHPSLRRACCSPQKDFLKRSCNASGFSSSSHYTLP